MMLARSRARLRAREGIGILASAWSGTATGAEGASATIGAEVAQLVEHGTENPGVASSILALGTNDAVSLRGTSGRKWLSW